MCNPFHGHAWLIVPFLRTARKKTINSTEQFPPPQRMISLSGWPLHQACQPGKGSVNSTSSLWLCSVPRRHACWSPQMPFPSAPLPIMVLCRGIVRGAGSGERVASSMHSSAPWEETCSSLGCNDASWATGERGCWRSDYCWIDTIMSTGPSTKQLKLTSVSQFLRRKVTTSSVLYLRSQECCISVGCVVLNTDLALCIVCETCKVAGYM